MYGDELTVDEMIDLSRRIDEAHRAGRQYEPETLYMMIELQLNRSRLSLNLIAGAQENIGKLIQAVAKIQGVPPEDLLPPPRLVGDPPPDS